MIAAFVVASSVFHVATPVLDCACPALAHRRLTNIVNKLSAFLTPSLASGLWLLMPAITNAEDPRLSVTLLNPIAQVSPGVSAVSNVQRIEIEVTLDKLNNGNLKLNNTSLKRLSGSPVNPGPDKLPTNYLLVKVSDQTAGGVVPVKTAMFGTGGKGGAESIKLAVEIPEEAAVRTGKIQDFINQIKAKDLASGAANQAQVNKLTAQNSIAIAALEKRYMENRLGQFSIVVEYHSTQQGAWNGRVVSVPLVVEVQNKGSFFDGF